MIGCKFRGFNTMPEQVNENQKNIKTIAEYLELKEREDVNFLDLTHYSGDDTLTDDEFAEVSKPNIYIVYTVGGEKVLFTARGEDEDVIYYQYERLRDSVYTRYNFIIYKESKDFELTETPQEIGGGGGGGATFEDVDVLPENPDPNTLYRVTSSKICICANAETIDIFNMRVMFGTQGRLNIIDSKQLPSDPIPLVDYETQVVTIYVIGDNVYGYNGEWVMNNDLLALLFPDESYMGQYIGRINFDYTNFVTGGIYLYKYYDYYLNGYITTTPSDNDLVFDEETAIGPDDVSVTFAHNISLRYCKNIRTEVILIYENFQQVINGGTIAFIDVDTLLTGGGPFIDNYFIHVNLGSFTVVNKLTASSTRPTSIRLKIYAK